MSEENIYSYDFDKLQKLYLKDLSKIGSQSDTNLLGNSDLRNNIIVNRLQREKIFDTELNIQKSESNELIWRCNSNNLIDKILLSDDIDLYKEYVQWDFIKNELYSEGERLLNIVTNKEKYEFTNTLQMWLNFVNQDFKEVPKYKYYPILPNIQLEHPGAQFLRTAIMNKRFVTEIDADEKIRKLLSFISERHSEVISHNLAEPLHVEYDSDRNLVVVNKFQIQKLGRINLLVEKGGIIATARMLLRYESFGNGSYEWGDPDEVHRVLYDKFNVRYEGFATPFNSRFIGKIDKYFQQ